MRFQVRAAVCLLSHHARNARASVIFGDLYLFPLGLQTVLWVITFIRGYCDPSCLLVRLLVHSCCGRISQKQLEIELRFQWNNNRKWHMANRMVTWSTMSRNQKGQGRDPNMFGANFLENGCRYNGAPVGNSCCGNGHVPAVWWRHVTLKGPGRVSDIPGRNYLENR